MLLRIRLGSGMLSLKSMQSNMRRSKVPSSIKGIIKVGPRIHVNLVRKLPLQLFDLIVHHFVLRWNLVIRIQRKEIRFLNRVKRPL